MTSAISLSPTPGTAVGPAARVMHLRRLVPVVLVVTTPLTGCGAPTDPGGGDAIIIDYREAWSAPDNPSLLDANFNYTFTELPTSGAAKKTPWASYYWPTYQDSVNVRWAGADSQSAAKKYELAFGKTGVEDAVSAYTGIDSLIGIPCTSDAECAAEKGSVCAKRVDEASGTCIPTWFGICHAWAPAAILEDEPKQPVVFNGVEFKVNDLKALMSLAYTDDLDVKFVSLRCDEAEEGVDLGGVAACKDTNAGTFHVIVTNLLGLRGEAFIEDRIFDDEVWNFPVRSFKVTRNLALTGLQANQLLAAGEALSSVEKTGTIAAGAWTQVHNLAVEPGQTLRVRMTGTGDADLYARWNAEPDAASYQCRPYRVASEELCEIVVPADAETAYIAVNGYAPTSKYTITTTLFDVPASAYAFNPEAVSLRQIQIELNWIGASDSAIDGNLAATIDQYTKKDVYDYVLELDAAGKVIGGEWISGSRINHPDFLWKPLVKHPGTVADVLDFADVRKLFDLANGQ